MSSLPPYSTYRTDNKQMMYPQAISHGNILTFTPPGFKQTLNVKFPDCRLAVCEKCKKNYKTRDMCRVRNSHTAEPWTTAYICITLDDTCTDSEGKFIDKPLTVRMVQWQPFCVKKPFDPKTPVCSACKKTNRTRSFCRERHKHRQLPWCTVYVLLSALDSADPSTLVAAPSKPVASEDKPENGNKPEGTPEEKKSDSPEEEKTPEETESSAKATEADGEAKEPVADVDAQKVTSSETEEKPSKEAEEGQETPKSDTPKEKGEGGEDEEGDDINDIAESRTFLAKVSCRSNTIHWLELAEFDASDANTVHGLSAPDSHMQNMNAMRPGGAVQTMDPQQAQYYAQAMGYAQQHHHALKSHQQYFFQMQQRQQHQYAAQAAWQAQYNQPGVQVQGQPAPAPAAVANGQPAPAPVTAGEAAAQQQKQGQNVGAPPVAVPQQPSQPQAGHEQTAGAAAAAATAAQQQQQQQPQQANPQWQAQMMYHQQLYQQQQMQMQQPQAPQQQVQPGQQQMAHQQQAQPQQPQQAHQMQQPQHPPQQQMQPQYGSQPQMPQGPPGGEMGEPGPVDTMAGGEENDAKRARYV